MEQGVNLLANFALPPPFFSHYGNMRTSSETHYFRGEACSKNNSLREWVDSRVPDLNAIFYHTYCFSVTKQNLMTLTHF